MTKKDYELIAGAVRASLIVERSLLLNDSPSASKEAIEAIRTLARSLSLTLSGTNTNYNQSKFLEACGMGES